jgi:hypothetical protein
MNGRVDTNSNELGHQLLHYFQKILAMREGITEITLCFPLLVKTHVLTHISGGYTRVNHEKPPQILNSVDNSLSQSRLAHVHRIVKN